MNTNPLKHLDDLLTEQVRQQQSNKATGAALHAALDAIETNLGVYELGHDDPYQAMKGIVTTLRTVVSIMTPLVDISLTLSLAVDLLLAEQQERTS